MCLGMGVRTHQEYVWGSRCFGPEQDLGRLRCWVYSPMNGRATPVNEHHSLVVGQLKQDGGSIALLMMDGQNGRM